MKTTVEGKALARALELVGGALAPRGSLPVLATIRVTAAASPELMRPGTLTLVATDLDQTIEATIPAHVTEDGVRCVNGAKFIAVMKELVGSEIRLSAEGEAGVVVRSTSGRFSIYGLPPDDFPVGAAVEADPIVVKADSLAAALRNTEFAASEDSARYTLNGIRMKIVGKESGLAATDGHRLVTVDLPLEKGVEGIKEVIVPAKSVRALVGILKGHQEAEVRIDHHTFSVSVDGAKIATRLIEGQFPNTEAVIPKTDGRPLAILPAKDLMAAVRQASLMADERNRPTKLQFGPDTLTLVCQSGDMGESEITLPVAWLQHAPAEVIAVGINAKYLLEYLPLVAGEVTVSIKDGLSPLLFNGKPTDEGKKTAPEYVLMPLRI